MGEDENLPGASKNLLTLTLTRAQLKLIDECLSTTLESKGYEELVSSYTLMTSIKRALSAPSDAFGGEYDE